MFGDNLRKIRHEKGLTQKEVAEKLNIDRTTYTKYETGATEPALRTIKAIAELYNTDYNALFFQIDKSLQIKSQEENEKNDKYFCRQMRRQKRARQKDRLESRSKSVAQFCRSVKDK